MPEKVPILTKIGLEKLKMGITTSPSPKVRRISSKSKQSRINGRNVPPENDPPDSLVEAVNNLKLEGGTQQSSDPKFQEQGNNILSQVKGREFPRSSHSNSIKKQEYNPILVVNLDGHVVADESPGLDSSIKVEEQKMTEYNKNNFTT